MVKSPILTKSSNMINSLIFLHNLYSQVKNSEVLASILVEEIFLALAYYLIHLAKAIADFLLFNFD